MLIEIKTILVKVKTWGIGGVKNYLKDALHRRKIQHRLRLLLNKLLPRHKRLPLTLPLQRLQPRLRPLIRLPHLHRLRQTSPRRLAEYLVSLFRKAALFRNSNLMTT